MSSMTIGLISAGCIFGGALLGFLLQGLLPEGHLRDNSKDTVKVVGGMIATLEPPPARYDQSFRTTGC
jgi:hypothetical protein